MTKHDFMVAARFVGEAFMLTAWFFVLFVWMIFIHAMVGG